MIAPVDRARQLERSIGVVLRVGVAASSVCLAVGLVLSLLTGEGTIANVLLNAGIIILLLTPVARVIVSIIEYIGERDWTFATLTIIVLVELMASAVAALVFKPRV